MQDLNRIENEQLQSNDTYSDEDIVIKDSVCGHTIHELALELSNMLQSVSAEWCISKKAENAMDDIIQKILIECEE